MALVMGKFNGGTTRAKLSAVLGVNAKQFRQFTLYADPDNSGSVYLGGVDVTQVPANEHLRLKAGVSMNLGPDGANYPFVVDTDTWYVIGSAASQILYMVANTDDGR